MFTVLWTSKVSFLPTFPKFEKLWKLCEFEGWGGGVFECRCIHANLHVCTSDVGPYLPPCLKTGSVVVCHSIYQTGLRASGDSSVSPPLNLNIRVLNYRYMVLYLAFMRVLGINTQVLKLTRQKSFTP